MAENSSCSSASSCSRESCEGCPSKAKGGNGIAKEPMNPSSNVKKVIGVVSGKGGVGKSFVTASLACAMKQAGYKVGIMDADITGPSIPKMLGVHGQVVGTEEGMIPLEAENGIKVMSVNLLLDNEEDPVIWRGPVLANMVKQFWSDVIWGELDFLFVDMPPGTGDVSLSVFQSIPLDGIIIVASPQELVSMVVEKAVRMAEMMEVPIVGLVENMSYVACPDCGRKIYLFGQGKTAEAAKAHKLPLLAEMPIDPALAALVDAGDIESFKGDWLKGVADRLENK